MTEQEKARRRAEVVELLRRNMQTQLDRRYDEAFMQADAMAYASAALSRAEVKPNGRLSWRTFGCQGCGKASAILHGTSMRCGCGSSSAAEVLPP